MVGAVRRIPGPDLQQGHPALAPGKGPVDAGQVRDQQGHEQQPEAGFGVGEQQGGEVPVARSCPG